MSARELESAMLYGLQKLACLLSQSHKEINFGIHISGCLAWDVPFIAAANTPNASQIVCDGHGHYDVWSVSGNKLLSTNLDCKQAADIVITEYFWAKAMRIKEREPERDFDMIMQTLHKGYQKDKKPVWLVAG
jgi:hypothetical protein